MAVAPFQDAPLNAEQAKAASFVDAPLPDFKATNDPPSRSLWEMANTPLVPQIAEAAHAIADHISTPRLDESQMMAQIKGFFAGATEGVGNLAAGYTSPVGIALMLSGLSGESTIGKAVPGLKSLLELPAVKGLQRAVQVGAGTGFAAHGAQQVATAPTLAGKAQGVVEAATGALGALSSIPTPSRANQPILVNPNAADGAAARFGLERGVSVDAGMATGNKAIKGVQFLSDRSLGGSLVAGPAREAQTQALGRVGGELADQALGAAVSPEQAGEGIRAALNKKVGTHSRDADAAYDTLRQLERTPTARSVGPTRSETTVDVRPAKSALRPVYEQMMRQMPRTQRDASPGLQSLGNILDGPDFAPLSQVDLDLSSIKAIAREKGGLAKLAAGTLDRAVQDAARRGGPEVVRALNDGRQATIAKVKTEDLIGALPGGKMEEPIAIFKRATAPKDGGIEFLRAVKEHTPQALPQIARAKLEELLTMAPDKQFAEWNKIGTETRAILFPKVGQTQELNHFCLLSKKLAENPNPSGSAMVASLGLQGGLLANPLTFVPALLSQVGAAGLSAMLHNPNVARALTQTLSVATKPAASGAARAAALASLSAAVQRAGLPALSPALGRDESRLATGAPRK